MKQLILSMIGDGNGNVSAARVLALGTVAGTFLTKIYNAWLTKQPIVFDTTDFGLIASAFGLKLGSHILENQSDKQTGVQTTPTK